MEFMDVINFYKSLALDKKRLNDEQLLEALKIILAPDYLEDLESVKSNEEYNEMFNVIVFSRLLNLIYESAPDYWLKLIVGKGCSKKEGETRTDA